MTHLISFPRRAGLAGSLVAGLLAAASAAAAPADSRQDYRSAVIPLENALQQRPADAELRRQLALVNLEWGRGAEAEQDLRQALQAGGPGEALLTPLLESLLMQGKYQAAVDEKLPLADLPADRLATLLALRGEAWLGLQQPDKAQKEIERGLALAPDNLAAKLARARLDQYRGQQAEADRRVSEVLAAAPDDAKAWSLKAALLEAAKQPEQAEAAYGRAIARRRFSPIDRASRAILRIEAGRLAEAQADLEVLQREASTGFLTHYAGGLMALKTGRYPDAQAAFEQALKLNDRFQSIQYYLGIAHFQQGHDREAEQHVQAFAAQRPEVTDAAVLLASLKFRGGRREEARALLNTILAQHPTHLGALQLSSDVEFLSGNRKKGLQLLRRVAELKPRQRTQDLAGGTQADAAAVLAAGGDAAHRAAAEILVALREGRFDQARAVVTAFRASFPESPLPDHFAGLIALAENAPGPAQAHFEAALAKSPGDPVLSHRLADLALRRQDTAAARRLYETALAQHPGDYATRMHLAALSEREGRPADLDAQLTALIHDYPTALEPRLVLAGYLLNAGQPSRAEALLEDIRDGYPHHSPLGALLVKAQIANRQPGPALATAKALVADNPGSALAHYLLAHAYAENHDRAAARAELDQALAADPSFLPARHTALRWRLADGDVERANRDLDALARERPADVDVLLLQAWAAAAQHRFPDALKAAEAAWTLAQTSATATALAKARWQHHDRPGALTGLEAWIHAHPADAGARVAAADLYAAAGQPETAAAHLEQILKDRPDHLLVLNNLAWLYRPINPGKALDTARRAAALAPHAATVLDTLALVELDRGQADKAVELLTHAAAQKDAGGAVHYHLALALERTGQQPAARRALQAALADPRGFSERPEATALMAKLAGS